MVPIPVKLGLVVFAALLGVAPAFAQWMPNGVPVYPGGIQQDTGIIRSDGRGGAYVVWREQRIDHLETDEDNYIQHITPLGFVDPAWPAGGFPIAIENRTQNATVPVVGPDGAVHLAWIDSRGTSNDIYASRILPNAALSPGWPLNGLPVCVAHGQQLTPFQSIDEAGGSFILWNDYRHEIGLSRIYWTRLTESGQRAPGWQVDGDPYLGYTGRRGMLQILPSGNGGVFVLWTDDRGESPYGGRLYVTLTLSDGSLAPGWPSDGTLLTTSGSTVEIRKIATDGAGGVFVGWNENRNGSPGGIFDPWSYDLYAQHVMADGTIDPRWPADGLPVCNLPGGQYDFDLESDGAGGAFFFWQDLRAGPGQVYGMRILADGSPAPGWTAQGKPLSTNPQHKFTPRAVPDQQGGFYGTWEQHHPVTGLEEIYGQHVRADGSLHPGWPVEGLRLAGGPDVACRSAFSTTSDGSGGMLLAFQANYADRILVQAHRVAHDGPVPTLLSLVDAVVDDGEVVLRWQAHNAASRRAFVERRTESEEWSTVGSPELEGTDRLVYRERPSAGRHAYRLRYDEDGAERWTEPTWLEVGISRTLALAGFRPNPARSEASIAFTLPDAAPATLLVHDARGRIVSRHDVGSRGAGAHLVRLDDAPLAAGLYWVRLVRGDQVLQAKGVVIR